MSSNGRFQTIYGGGEEYKEENGNSSGEMTVQFTQEITAVLNFLQRKIFTLACSDIHRH